MKKTLFAATLIAGTTAFAGVTVDLRSDYRNEQKYTDAANADAKGRSYFNMQRARVRMTGKINDSISTNMRFNLLKTSDPTTFAAGGASDFVNYAEVKHQMNDMFALTVGKLSDMGFSAFEGQASPGDMYVTSSAYIFPSYMGAKGSFAFGNHTANVYMFNGAADNDATQSRSGMGLDFRTKLMENLKLMIGYHSVPTTVATGDYDTNYTSLGVEYKMDALLAEFDYMMNTALKQSTTGLADKKTTSMVLNFKYDMGAFAPVFKYTVDTMTDKITAGDVTDKGNKMALGFEYKPFPSDSFRYHVVYTSTVSQADSLRGAPSSTYNDKVTQTALIAGVRYTADVLK